MIKSGFLFLGKLLDGVRKNPFIRKIKINDHAK